MRAAGVVGHDVDFRLADDVATEVLLEVDCGLEGHAEVAGLVVGAEELVRVVDVEDIAPAASVVGLEEGGKFYVVEDGLPVERELEVAAGLGGDLGREAFVRQKRGAGDGDAELGGKGVVEEFVIGRPPEGVVDDLGAGQCGVLQVGAVEGHVVRDTVDDDGITGGLVHLNGAELDELGADAINFHGVDALHQGAGEGVFLAEQDADLFHVLPLSLVQSLRVDLQHLATKASRGQCPRPRRRGGRGGTGRAGCGRAVRLQLAEVEFVLDSGDHAVVFEVEEVAAGGGEYDGRQAFVAVDEHLHVAPERGREPPVVVALHAISLR